MQSDPKEGAQPGPAVEARKGNRAMRRASRHRAMAAHRLAKRVAVECPFPYPNADPDEHRLWIETVCLEMVKAGRVTRSQYRNLKQVHG